METTPIDPADIEEIERALGADRSIQIGRFSILELVDGTSLGAIETAKSLLDFVEDLDEPRNAIDKAVVNIHGLLTDAESSLDDHQARHALYACDSLVALSDRLENGESLEVIISQLFDLYFVNQQALTETRAGHWLRVLGDDLAIERGFDFDRAWQIYQNSIKKHERRFSNGW